MFPLWTDSYGNWRMEAGESSPPGDASRGFMKALCNEGLADIPPPVSFGDRVRAASVEPERRVPLETDPRFHPIADSLDEDDSTPRRRPRFASSRRVCDGHTTTSRRQPRPRHRAQACPRSRRSKRSTQAADELRLPFETSREPPLAKRSRERKS